MISPTITAVGADPDIVAKNWAGSFDYAIENLVSLGFDKDHSKLMTFSQVFGQGATIPAPVERNEQQEPTALAFGVQQNSSAIFRS